MMGKLMVLFHLGLQALVVLGASTTPAAKETTPAPKEDSCRNFLSDQCFHPGANDPQIEILHNVTITDCQFFCQNVYSENCTFFIQDKRQNICEIWTIPEDEYEKDCVKAEGPVTPKIDNRQSECDPSSDPCVVS